MNNLKMKDMAENERPYEKCIAYGPEALNDAELIAVIIRSGSKENNALVTAQKILNAHPIHKGIIGLNFLSVDQLTSIDGIGTVKAMQMQCIAELSKRMARSEFKSFVTLESPESIVDYYMEKTRYMEQESVFILLFDAARRLIKERELSAGTINYAVVSPRDVFTFALEYKAVYVVLVHNHPSGEPEPSIQDIMLTKRISSAGRLVGIELSDHIIIGDKCYVSLTERGYIKNETTKKEKN